MNKATKFDAEDIRARIMEGCTGLTLGVNADTFAAQCTHFLAELQRWNKAYNLTAVREPAEMVIRHVLDSLTVLPWIAGDHIADVGTGPGFPGIPLALCWQNSHFTLLDSNNKKTRFVTHACGALRIENVTVVHSRAEDFQPEELFTTVVCRAFTSLAEFAEKTDHMLAEEGRLVAMKGKKPSAEIDALPATWQVAECVPVDVMGLEEERHVVVMQRAATERE